MSKKENKKDNAFDKRYAKLTETEKRAAKEFDEVTKRLDSVLESRAWTAEEEAELAKASQKLSSVRAELKAEAQRKQEAREALAAREKALGESVTDSGVGGARVKNGVDNLTYGPGNPDNSYYRDLYAAYGFNMPSAQRRLNKHAEEMANIFKRASRDSKERRALEGYFIEARRQAGALESRATILNGGPTVGNATDMAAFAPPLFFLPEYAAYRTYGRTLLNILKKQDLPATGLSYFVPKITTPTQAQIQTAENVTVSTRDMVSQYESGTLQTIVNNLQVSQQYLDRVGPGIAGDQIVNDDQTRQLNRLLNIYAWQTLLQNSGIGTIAYTDTTTTYTTFNGGAVADYVTVGHNAKAAIQKTDGLVAYPTHFITDVDLWESIEGAVDANKRPYVVPQGVAFNPLVLGDTSGVPEGYTGFNLMGLPAFKDQALNVAAAQTVYAGNGVGGTGAASFDADSGNHLGVVGAFDIAVVWMEGTPVQRVLPQPGAASLTVLIQQYVYCALVPVYPNGVQVISSAGTASSVLAALTA